ncbi:MAG: hypothetical protein ABI890_05150 [Lapillicoccus sp.]
MTDDAILEHLREVHNRLDPPPSDLDDLVIFSLAATDLDAEIAHLSDSLVGSGARDTAGTRTVGFESGGMSVLLTLVDEPGGTVRIDGWIAPPAVSTIELRTRGSRRRDTSTRSDDTGRFALAAQSGQLVQLVVRTGDTRVVMPAVTL